MLNNYYQNHEEKLSKKAPEKYQNLKKRANMLVIDREIFLKKEKKRRINMVMNNIKSFRE